ncbi:MAG: AraC family transcriptional regulator [Clostridia bacterium]|nr:AraC family transcriptional regulator [Clostridia bacterium]NCC43423.1 AraC family transcriptional regulator [Clostridia bacterium]
MKLYSKDKTYIGLTSFYALSLQGYDMHPHTHESFEIMYVTNGSCYIYLGEEESCLKEHQFVLLDGRIPHRLLIPNGQLCSVLNIEFFPQMQESSICIADVYKASPAFQKLCGMKEDHLTATDNRNLGYALKDLITHLELVTETTSKKQNIADPLTQKEYDYLSQILFQRIIIELCGCKTGAAPTGALYVKRACSYIQAHLMEDIRIPMIAAYAGINKSYLQSLFSSHMNCTISEYINQKKMDHAVFLLVNSSLSVTDIAFHSGYNSRQHFGSTFERFYGVSPKTYRLLHHKNIQPSTGDARITKMSTGNWELDPV